MAWNESPGLEAGTRAGIFRKTKEISEYDQPIHDWENPDEEVQIPRGQGCMRKDEGGSQKKG
jgi:hypothetical protein